MNKRVIYTVHAWIVDANGTKNNISGYPKDFRSESYNDDPGKTFIRAEGDMCEVWGAMCKVDSRQIQTVALMDIFGNVLQKKTRGDFPEPVVT